MIRVGTVYIPEAFRYERNDCTVIGLAKAANIPYRKVHEAFKKNGRKDKHGIRTFYIAHSVFKMLGLKTRFVKRKGTIETLIKRYPKGHLFCLTYKHAFAIVDGITYDQYNKKQRIKAAWLIKNPQPLFMLTNNVRE